MDFPWLSSALSSPRLKADLHLLGSPAAFSTGALPFSPGALLDVAHPFS